MNAIAAGGRFPGPDDAGGVIGGIFNSGMPATSWAEFAADVPEDEAVVAISRRRPALRRAPAAWAFQRRGGAGCSRIARGRNLMDGSLQEPQNQGRLIRRSSSPPEDADRLTWPYLIRWQVVARMVVVGKARHTRMVGSIIPTVYEVSLSVRPVVAIRCHLDHTIRSNLDVLGELQHRTVEELQNTANMCIEFGSTLSKNA